MFFTLTAKWLPYGTTDSTVCLLCKAINDLCRGSMRISFIYFYFFFSFLIFFQSASCQSYWWSREGGGLIAQLVSVCWLKCKADCRKTHHLCCFCLCWGIKSSWWHLCFSSRIPVNTHDRDVILEPQVPSTEQIVCLNHRFCSKNSNWQQILHFVRSYEDMKNTF